jgi:hypothetical protein
MWHLTSYLVDGNGRAHCGKRIKVHPGEEVFGGMELTDASTNTWTVTSTRLNNNDTSTFTASLGDKKIDAAYLTVEGMIIYGCSAYPSNDGVNFYNNTLKLGDGSSVSPSWVSEVRHSECDQHITVGENGDCKLNYDPSM